MIPRRRFVVAAAVVLAAPLVAEAQRAGKSPRIGVLVPAEPASLSEPNIAAFRQALHNLGYVDGQNCIVEYRYAHGVTERYKDLVLELIRVSVDIMVIGSGLAAIAAKNATQTIPIVFVGAASPVGDGLVASLARPGGNVTGLSVPFDEGFAGKWVELLKAAAPRTSGAVFLRDARNPLSARFSPHVLRAARALSLKLEVVEVQEIQELEGIFARKSTDKDVGLIVNGETLFFPHRSHMPELAAKYRLPAIYQYRVFVDAGGLMAYGFSLPDAWRRAATYVAKVLKGAKPADLPVEQATKFELIINLKTAKALGLTMSPSLLARADQVIE